MFQINFKIIVNMPYYLRFSTYQHIKNWNQHDKTQIQFNNSFNMIKTEGKTHNRYPVTNI